MKKLETKVIAATGGAAGAAAAISPFILWLLGVNVWHASSAAGKAAEAVAAVPAPVSGAVLFVITGLVTLVLGYTAPHTHVTTPP